MKVTTLDESVIEIIYHDGTDAIPCPPGQTGGFENADGNGEVQC